MRDYCYVKVEESDRRAEDDSCLVENQPALITDLLCPECYIATDITDGNNDPDYAEYAYSSCCY